MTAPATEAGTTAAAPVGAPVAVPVRRQRVRSHPAPLTLVFAALLFVFPSSVVLAGPLMSNGHPLRLLGLVALTVLALDLLRRRRDAPAVVPGTVVLLLLYLAHELFFYGWPVGEVQDDPDDAAGALRVLLFTLAACGIALYTATRVRSLRTVSQVLGVLVAGSCLNALVGVLQAVGAPVVWAQLMAFPGMQLVGSVRGGGLRFGLVRVVGTASHPIEFAVVLGCCLPFAMHLALHARTRGGRQAATGAALLMALSLPFALSRGGLLCIAISMLVFLAAQTWGTRLTAAAAAVVAACLAYVLVPSTYTAVTQLFSEVDEDISIQGRTDDLPLVDAAFNAAPWLGGAPVPDDLILDNQWFIVLVDRGLVGLVALVLLFAVPFPGLVATAWRSRGVDPERQSLAAALAGCVLATAVSGAVFDLLFFGTAAMLVFLVIGLSAAVVRPRAQVAGAAQPASAVAGSTG